MRSESLHTTPQGSRQGETVTESGIILPAEVGKSRNIRETIQFDHSGNRADKYNSPGVDPDNPYNAFAPSVSEAVELSVESSDASPMNIPDKYKLSPEDEAAVKSNLEKMIGRPLDAEVEPTVNEKVLEKVTEAIDEGEKVDHSQNEKISELTEQVAALTAQVAALEEMVRKLSEEKSTTEAAQEVEKELASDQPRRVRKQDGVEERLVKYADGSFGWVEIGEAASGADEVGGAEEAEVVATPEAGKDSEKLDEIIIPEQAQEQLKELRAKLEKAQEAGDTAEEYSLIDEILTQVDSIDGLSEEARSQIIEGIKEQPEGEVVVEGAAESAEGIKVDLEIPPEIMEAVDKAGDRYAEETAKTRNNYMGHFLGNSKFWVKIAPLRKLAESINERIDRPVNEARDAYEKSILAMQDEIDRQYIEAVDEEALSSKEFEKSLRVARKLMLLEAQPALESKILQEREKQSGKTNKFVNWWVSREGIKGKVVKALAVGGVGVGVGLATSLLTIPALGAVLGGAAGLAISNHVTKRRANAVNKEGVTLAARQSAEDLQKQREFVEGYSDDDTIKGDIDVTRVVESRTASEKSGNRARVKTATAVAAAGGGIGAGIGEAIRGAVDAAAQPAPARASGGVEGGLREATPVEVPPPEVPPPPEFIATDFKIQGGSGFIKEIEEFVGANGQSISSEQATQLHNELRKAFGTYINDASGNPIRTYLRGNDIRISAPGKGQWAPGVAEYIKTWMSAKGLW